MVKPIDTLTMQKQLANKFIHVVTFAFLCSFAQEAIATSMKSLKFDNIFKVLGEPKTLHYKASFGSTDGQNHTLQVWRDGQLHLRRKTDDVIDSYVIRDKKNLSAYQMIIVDYKKRVSTRINRNDLIHLGSFNDWFDMSHGLRHPKGDYKLTFAQAPAMAKPIASCQWYQLQQNQISHHICWSTQDRIPLEIWDDQKHLSMWTVTNIDHKVISRDIFQLHDTGFIRNDANDDIEND